MGKEKKRRPAGPGDPARAGKRNFDPWAAFTSLAKTGVSLPLLFTPQIAELSGELARIVSGRSTLMPRKGDTRFQSEEWQVNPVYKASMQAYLAWCNSMEAIISASALEEPDKSKARRAVNLLTDYLSPSHSEVNFNVINRAYKTRGASLVHGLQRMAEDITQGTAPGQRKTNRFELGKSLATTQGAVIFQNEQLELIQYQPGRAKVRKIPLLMVPSPVNKYYLYDLQEKNSLVNYLTRQGHQVFNISWRNPGHAHKDWNMETYLCSLLAVFEVVAAVSKSPRLNLFGLSAGGLLAAVASCAGTNSPAPSDVAQVNSLSLATTSLDTRAEPQIGSLLNSQIIAAAKTLIRIRGTMDGKELAQLFTWLRPNNLMWNAWVCNYFVGEDIPGPDVLHWNRDAMNIPAELNCDFLDLYRNSPAQNQGRLQIGGNSVDLSEIKCGSYLIAGSSDHVSPWETCYRSSFSLGGEREFVLVNRGHTRTLICPEQTEGLCFYTHSEALENPEDWLSEATQHRGSWWPHWLAWLDRRAGTLIKAPAKPGSKNYPALRDAPGQYVLE